MKQVVRDSAGMTVVEVIIALGVVTVGLLALISAMPRGTSLIGESNLKTTATFLAQQRLEQVKNAQWTFATPCPGVASPAGCDSLGGSSSNGGAAVAAWPDEPAVTSYPRFQRQVRICDCSVAACNAVCGIVSTNQVRRVGVTVTFTPMAGTGQMSGATPESVVLVTLVAQRP